MKQKNIIVSVGMSVLFLFCACSCQKGGAEEDHGDPNANRTIPTGHTELTIEKTGNGNKLINFGAQLDPFFTLSGYNEGRSGTGASGTWRVDKNDWETVVVPRIREMQLPRIRMMLMPGWFAPEEQCYTQKDYVWDSAFMQSVYDVLDTAQENKIEVNVTVWGTDGRAPWLLEEGSAPTTWLGYIADDRWDDFGGVCADAFRYLIEEKGYTCIKEATLFNEPTQDFLRLGRVQGFANYVSICKEFDSALKTVGVRDKIKLVLSDDTQDSVWLGATLSELEGVYDGVSSHSYSYGKEYTNDNIQNTLNTYALKYFRQAMEGYEHVPHIWDEFGLNTGLDTHTVSDADTAQRGFEIARVALNMLYAGSSGVSYWTLFNQYYDEGNRIMNMGLWRYADDGYDCNPVYYSYSMFTRFCKKDMEIFPIKSDDGDLMGIALKAKDGNWTYLLTNSAAEEKKVSFVNNTKFPTTMSKYVYDENNVPTDNKVIGSSGKVTADGRVLSDTVGARCFVLYTTYGGSI